MKRTSAVAWALALFTVILPTVAFAANASHLEWATGITCDTCHQPHRTLGKSKGEGPITRLSPAVFNNMCQSCHRTGDGFAKSKPMALVDTSAIFGDHSTQSFGKLRQTSHRWDGSDINPAAGAQPPIQAAMTTSGSNKVGNLRGRSGNELACVRCHAPHLDNAPGAMLRMPIDQAQMCVDCHRSRDTSNVALNPDPLKSGTHPVNVNYAAAVAKGNFYDVPQNANPINPTSNLGNYLTKTAPSGNVVCTTCHGVHYTDSRSSTFDGASTAKGKGNYTNLSTGDGYQLRTDRRGAKVLNGTTDKLNICTNCHSNKFSHNAKDQNVQCIDCHGAHVAYDPTNSSSINPQNINNVNLIRRNVKNGNTPNKIYFRYTGSKREYVNTSGTGVCQGCHNVPEAGGKYPAEHDSKLAADCQKCHFHSSQAGSFSGNCGQCHGMPPDSATPGAGGLAKPATGALAGAVGAHAKHVNGALKMECNTCHDGYSTREMPNATIDLGFAINGINVPGFNNVMPGGLYNNTNTLLNSTKGPIYKFVGSGFGGAGANQTCSAIYCHGYTLTGGTNKTPSWVDGSSQAACGTCHGATSAAPPTAGSHARHAGAGTGQLAIPCASCHGLHADNKHVNGNVKWNFAGLNGGQYKTPSGRFYTISGSTGRLAPSTAYGTCTAVYCHSNSGPNNTTPVTTAAPTWGGATLNCGSCHANMATTLLPNGGHFTHASNSAGPKMDCSSCHTGYTATTTNGTTHANKVVEISSTSGYTKTQPIAAGTAWGTCSNGNCHGQATGLVWGGSIGYKDATGICSTCHSSTTGVTAGTPFYSTSYPGGKQILNTDAKVGAHTYHLTNINVMNASLVCADCHGPVALNDATHMNGTTNFKWTKFANHSGLTTPTYNSGTGTCSNVYCHGFGLSNDTAVGVNRTPSWKTPWNLTTLTPASCKSCHGFPPLTATHPNFASPSSFPTAACTTCHPNVRATGTTYADIFVSKTMHINGHVEGGGCNGCHGYPPSNKRFTGSAGNWADARMENYTGGGGAHTITAHISPMATQDQAWANCTNCHNQSDHVTSPVAFNPSSNIKVTVNPKFKFATDRTAKYNSNKLDGNLHIPGNCSNVSCHFQKTPQW